MASGPFLSPLIRPFNIGLFKDAQQIARMASQGGAIFLVGTQATRSEALHAVHKPIAQAAFETRDRHQRLCRKRLDGSRDVLRRTLKMARDADQIIEREAAGKDGQEPQQRSLLAREEPVAPIQTRPQRLMSET